MAKRLKTAPELERLILLEMHRHAVCAGVAAVTVRESADLAGTNWTLAHVNAPGGAVPAPCQSVCMTRGRQAAAGIRAVARVRAGHGFLSGFPVRLARSGTGPSSRVRRGVKCFRDAL